MSLTEINDLLTKLLAIAGELAPDLPSHLIEQAVIAEIFPLVSERDFNLASDSVKQAIG
jgi:hypothetical protein